MAITISGVNNNDRIVASDGTIDALSGFNVVGVMTAASFSGDLIGNVTGNVTGNINNTTLLLQTSGTERIRITGAGNVGVGTTAPANVLQVKTAVDGSGLTIQRDSTTVGTYAQLSFTNTTTDNYTAPTWIRTLRDSGGVNASPMTFGTAGAEKLRIQSGGGISFNGDTAATNALDDYEEGTCTLTLESDTNPATTNSSGAVDLAITGSYVKIGKMVTVTGLFNNLHSAGSSTDRRNHGLKRIRGLPFTSYNGTGQSIYTASLGYSRGIYGRYSTAVSVSNLVLYFLYPY